MLIRVIETTLLLTIMTLSAGNVSGYKILGLFPYRGKSHFIMFESLMKGLAEKGHTVHVVSNYPLETPVGNYTDFSVAGSIRVLTGQLSLTKFDKFRTEIFGLTDLKWAYYAIKEHEGVMNSSAIQRLMDSKERYDLIITESFIFDATLGFVNKFEVPFIFLSSCPMLAWTSSLVANPQNPAFIPNSLLHFSPWMTFLERLENTLGTLIQLIGWYQFHMSENQRIMNKYFGSDTPPLLDIAKNVSLVMVNTHSSFMGSRPFTPNVIEVGGIHVRPAKQLPQDIENFIESSPHGVIYFCLGSMMRAASISDQKKSAFMFAFSQLKERVLWKFEEETIATHDNIMIKKWMPQRDILAHPKVKLFISHCGLLGTLEAVSEGKPILGIPFDSDQWMNCRALESKGYAKLVIYRTVDHGSILKAIQESLEPQYAEKAKEISGIFHDRPMTPMDTAIYWVEYVIRNKGAKHLRTPAVELPFYQYLLLDVVMFSLICVSATTYVIYHILNGLLVRMTSKVTKTKLT
uniref:UDP-glucuronosyltransferase n=1 Tax=Trialeurodes vaporariorum TaxID=88556 RepID=A0A873P534_TRIVP|nr:UDP-gluconosyltransferase [Trialeurodes vaporariorum]